MEVDTESQVDTVRVLASNKRDFSWEAGLESGSTLHGSIISGQRSLQTQGSHGQSLFIWLEVRDNLAIMKCRDECCMRCIYSPHCTWNDARIMLKSSCSGVQRCLRTAA